MANADLPYMLSVKNLGSILDRIREAGTPPKFTGEFLKSNLGFSSSTDRGVIPVLRALGFISPNGIPTGRYNEFRDASRSGIAVADGLREGWSAVFLSDQKAYDKSSGQLKELFKNVTGKGETVAEKMATTFKALATKADWTTATRAVPDMEPVTERPVTTNDLPTSKAPISLHHDIHLHLPPTSDVSVYAAIFRALRSELLDQ